MLLPVVGLTDVYFMKYSLVADHYAHLALIGVLGWAAAAFVQLRLPRGLAFGVALALGALTFAQTAIYRDKFALFDSVLARNPDCWMAHNNLAILLVKEERISEAAEHFREALRLKPNDAENENNLGTALSRLHRPAEAIPEYEAALRLKPDYPEVRFDLGLALLNTGRAHEAIPQFEQVLRLRPKSAAGYFALALALRKDGREEEAQAAYRQGSLLHPSPTPAAL